MVRLEDKSIDKAPRIVKILGAFDLSWLTNASSIGTILTIKKNEDPAGLRSILGCGQSIFQKPHQKGVSLLEKVLDARRHSGRMMRICVVSSVFPFGGKAFFSYQKLEGAGPNAEYPFGFPTACGHLRQYERRIIQFI